jgi:hypothetical protein
VDAWFKEVAESDGTITIVRSYSYPRPESRWRLSKALGGVKVTTEFAGRLLDGDCYYETAVKSESRVEYRRYKTRALAEEGHQQLVERWRRRLGWGLAQLAVAVTHNGSVYQAVDESGKVLMTLTEGGAKKLNRRLQQEGGTFDDWTRCERCGCEASSSTGSWFNTEQICSCCREDEEGHPDYGYAREVEEDAVRKGDLNFKGVGWPGMNGRVAR